MWQYYLVCGLSNLRGVGQEFHKLALLPENYIVKWCLRWIALMFTCRRSTDGSFHSAVKIQEKTITFVTTSVVHQRIDSSPQWCEQFQLTIACHMHDATFLLKNIFLHWFICVPSNQLSTVSISRMRQIIFLERMCRAEHGSCCLESIDTADFNFILCNFNSLTWVPQSKMTRLQGDSRLSGRHQKQIMKK